MCDHVFPEASDKIKMRLNTILKYAILHHLFYYGGEVCFKIIMKQNNGGVCGLG